MPDHPTWSPMLCRMLRKGTLASRIGQQIRRLPTPKELHTVCRELANCLHAGGLYRVD